MSSPSILRPDRNRSHEEKVGRRWLMISFIFCPCHLPAVMGVLALVFGGSAFGAFLSHNKVGVGVLITAVYAVLVWIGFRYLRRAFTGVDCSDGVCTPTG